MKRMPVKSNPIIGTNLLSISLHSRERERMRKKKKATKILTPMKLRSNEILGGDAERETPA